jgi:hypothetical protein
VVLNTTTGRAASQPVDEVGDLVAIAQLRHPMLEAGDVVEDGICPAFSCILMRLGGLAF